jgi:uncharacterized OB-fold protein
MSPPTGLIPPNPDPDSLPWWEGLDHGVLRAQRCNRCGTTFAPPTPTCPQCGTRDFAWTMLSGRGRIYSWVKVHIAMDPAFENDVPYSIAVVELEEGPRVVGRLLEGEGVDGLAVEAEIYRVEGQALLGFRPS